MSPDDSSTTATGVVPPVPASDPVTEEEIAAVVRALREVPLTTLYGDYEVERFENDFRTQLGQTLAIAVTSGTAALHTALAALDIGPGDEVITPTYSFVASASVIVQQGAQPVFCDIDPSSLNIDVRRCESLITPRTKAVIAVHIYGRPADVHALRGLCDARGIALVEDCAGAVGARVGGRAVGSFGEFGCFSFNVGKILRTGEGGMLTTASPELASRARALRVNGLAPGGGPNHVAMLGFNYTMAQPLAALGAAALRRFDACLARRRHNQEILATLGNSPQVSMLPLPTPDVEVVPFWTPFVLRPELAALRPAILRAARAENIPLALGYDEPLYRVAYLAKYAGPPGDYPVSEELSRRILVVDPAPFIGEDTMHAIVGGLRRILERTDELRAA
jgi:perosamine synthetase